MAKKWTKFAVEIHRIDNPKIRRTLEGRRYHSGHAVYLEVDYGNVFPTTIRFRLTDGKGIEKGRSWQLEKASLEKARKEYKQ